VTPPQLLTLEGFAEKSAQQLVDSIAASKRQPLSALLFALGIRHVGQQGASSWRAISGPWRPWPSASVEEVASAWDRTAIGEAVVGFSRTPVTRSCSRAWRSRG